MHINKGREISLRMAYPSLHPHLDVYVIFAREGRIQHRQSESLERSNTHSVHATSRSLFPLLGVPPFESFHLSVLLNQHRLCRRWPWISHSHLRRYTLWSGGLEWGMALMGRMWLVRYSWHGTRAWTLARWELLGSGSTWSSRHASPHATVHTTGHPTRHPTGHSAGHVIGHSTGHSSRHPTRHTAWNSTWYVPLHTRRNRSRYATWNIPNWRAASRPWHNSLSGFFSRDINSGKVYRVEGERPGWLVEVGIHSCC